MSLKYYRLSWQLIKSNLWIFVQIAIVPILLIHIIKALLSRGVVPGVFSLFLGLLLIGLSVMLPTIITGLEGIYLKIYRREAVKASDIFMYKSKFLPILGASILIGLETSLISFIYWLVVAGFFYLIPVGELLDIVGTVLSIIILIIIICRHEGPRLHSFNLIAEKDYSVIQSLKKSKLTTKNLSISAFLLFMYGFMIFALFGIAFFEIIKFMGVLFNLVNIPIYIQIFSELIIISLLIVTVGAQALLYVEDVDEIKVDFKNSQRQFSRKVFIKQVLIIAFAIAVIVFVIPRSYYILDESEQAVVEQFNKPIKVIKDAGFHFNLPWRKIHRYTKESIEVIFAPTQPKNAIHTRDNKMIKLNTTVECRIENPILFFQTGLSEYEIGSPIYDIVYFECQQLFSKHDYSEIVDRNEYFKNSITELSNIGINSYGIEIVNFQFSISLFTPKMLKNIKEKMGINL